MSDSITNGKKWAIVVSSFLLSALFIGMGGLTKLAGAPFQKDTFAHYGYPIWMMYGVGAVECLCGGMILLKRTRFFAALIMVGITVGVVFSIVRAGELTWRVLGSPAIVTMAIAGWVAIVCRPKKLHS